VDIRITCIVQFLNLANKIKGNFPKRTLVWAPTTQGSIQSAEARDSLSLLSGFKNSLALKEEKEKKGGFGFHFGHQASLKRQRLSTKLISKGVAASPILAHLPPLKRAYSRPAHSALRQQPMVLLHQTGFSKPAGNDSVLERHPQSRTVLAGNKKLTSRRMLRPLLAILDDLKTHVLAQYSAIGHTTDNLGHRRIGTSVHAVSTIALISECRHIRPCRPAITCNNVSKRIASPIVELYLCARTYPVAVWMSPPNWMPVSFKLVSLRSPFF
jgi:hypothetical protein